MKLSIIIPVYNSEPFLKRCLGSVFTSNDVEVIVVDDGSTDASGAILDPYDDLHKNFYVVHINHKGVSRARNVGMTLAIGDYITFLDSDDEFTKDGIRQILKCIDEGFDDNVIQFNHLRAYGTERPVDRFFEAEGFHQPDNLPKKWVLCWNKIYKRKFLLGHGIRFNESIDFEEDRLFNLECLKHTSGIQTSIYETVIKHDDNKQSICHTKTRERVIGISDELVKLLKEGQRPELERLIRRTLAEHWDSNHAKRLFGGEV